jgi:capsular polysaccharide transport system permease protein
VSRPGAAACEPPLTGRESRTPLSDTVDTSDPALAESRFEAAMAAQDYAACRAILATGHGATAEAAWRHCRLAEALYHHGRRAEAVECARAAFELEPESDAVASFCAWLFSNCDRHAEAAAAYERLLEARPRWAEGHRHASGSFAVAGQKDRAIFHAMTACALDPGAFELAYHAGCLLEAAGRPRHAREYFARASALDPENAAALRHLSTAALALDEPVKALDLALRAVRLDPDDRHNAIHASELLLRAERLEEAAEIAAAAVAAHPDDDIVLRQLSAVEMLRGRIEAALAAIEQALAFSPDTAEFHVHRGHLLYRLARFDKAAEAFERAAELDPGNAEVKRSQLTVYFDGGRWREAVAVGGELIRAAPDNDEYAQAVLQVLNRRREILDGEYVVLGERPVRPPRQRRTPTFLDGLRAQARVVHALIIRETRTRFGDARLGYGWALLEPILHIVMLSLVFAVMMRGRPPIGDQFFVFYYTGIIPYHLFVHTSGSMTFAVTSNGPLLQLPLVGAFDVILARGLLELATDLLVAVVLLALFAMFGLDVLPDDFSAVAAAVAAVWLLGCGCGFINAVVNVFFRSWDKIWAQLMRLLYFCSGIFYVPGMMPDWIRDILAWNPILHAVDWFRSGFFADYEPHWLDRSYLLAVAVATLLLGLGLERGLRRRLYEPQ